MQKNHNSENFPVASFLLPAAMRPHVMAFYDFARTADNIADDPVVSPDDKMAILSGMKDVLGGGGATAEWAEPARAMRASLEQSGVNPVHCLELLQAFQLDARQNRYRTWGGLMDYCRLSAAPVGRYLIELGGVRDADVGASDALCAALQVLNHLQDMGDDYKTLNRIYLPGQWLDEEGVEEGALAIPISSPALARVRMRALGMVDELLARASTLAPSITAGGNGALGREAAGIMMLARRLSGLLAKKDPLAGRVKAGGVSGALWFIIGAVRGK